MNAPKPYLYLDVDGPINVYESLRGPDFYDADVRCGFTGWRTLSLQLDRRHPALLAELAEAFTLAWGTAWEHDANARIGPLLGLGRLPVAEWGPDFLVGRPPRDEWDYDIHWKTAALADDADGTPFLWMDDECGPADNDWFAARGVAGHAMHVSPATGITVDHVEQALEWVQSLLV